MIENVKLLGTNRTANITYRGIKMKVIIFIAIVLTACTTKAPAQYYGVETDFSIYVEHLNKDLAAIGEPSVNTDGIRFYAFSTIKPGSTFVGLCSKGSDGKKISIIKTTETFEYYTYLIFVHEIGHCAYNKVHSTNRAAIMYPSTNEDNYSMFVRDEARLNMLKDLLNQGS